MESTKGSHLCSQKAPNELQQELQLLYANSPIDAKSRIFHIFQFSGRKEMGDHVGLFGGNMYSTQSNKFPSGKKIWFFSQFKTSLSHTCPVCLHITILAAGKSTCFSLKKAISSSFTPFDQQRIINEFKTS